LARSNNPETKEIDEGVEADKKKGILGDKLKKE